MNVIRMTKAKTLAFLEKTAEKARRELGASAGAPRIFLVPGSAMRRLERMYLGKKKKTVDVLSFPEPPGFPHPETRTKTLGEVYLNWDVNRAAPDRLAFLLVHAILHLLGYAHDKKHDRMQMKKMEKKLCGRLGIGSSR